MNTRRKNRPKKISLDVVPPREEELCTLHFIDTYIDTHESVGHADNGLQFYFKHNGKNYCVDATTSSGLGCMVNDAVASKANCRMVKILEDGEPKLCLIAKKQIEKDEELRYDYGVSDLPWRKLKKGAVKPVLYAEPKTTRMDHVAEDTISLVDIPLTNTETTRMDHVAEDTISLVDIPLTNTETTSMDVAEDTISSVDIPLTNTETTRMDHVAEDTISLVDIPLTNTETTRMDHVAEDTISLVDIPLTNTETTRMDHVAEDTISLVDIPLTNTETTRMDHVEDTISLVDIPLTNTETTRMGHVAEDTISLVDIPLTNTETTRMDHIAEDTISLVDIPLTNTETTRMDHVAEDTISLVDIPLTNTETTRMDHIAEDTISLVDIPLTNTETTRMGHVAEDTISLVDIPLTNTETTRMDHIAEDTISLVDIPLTNTETTRMGHVAEDTISLVDIPLTNTETTRMDHIAEDTISLVDIPLTNTETTRMDHIAEDTISLVDIPLTNTEIVTKRKNTLRFFEEDLEWANTSKDDIDSPSKKKIKEKTERKKKKKFEDEEEKKSLSSASAHKEKKTKKKKPDCDKMGPTDLYVKKHGNKKLKAGHMKPVTDALIVVDNTSDMPVPELEILGDSTDCTITKRCKKNIEYGYFDEDSEDIDNQDAMEDSFDDSTQDPDYSTESSDESIAHSDNVEAGYVSDSSSNMSDTVPLVDTLPVLSNTKCCSEINLSQTEKKPAISIQTSSNTKVQRVWDKVHYCFFCEISSTNISKHYLGPHQSEAEVQKILSYPKKSEARRLELLKLRNAGDYKHNTDILKKGEGVLVTWTRRPEDEVSSGDFLPCEDCLAFFLRSNLWRHRKVCPFRKEGAKYRKVQSEASFLLPSSHEVNKGLEMNVLRKMNADEITIAARNDRIITKVGEKLYQKHGHLPHLYSHVSQKMRELARLLIAVRGQQPDVNSLSDLLHPERFMLAVKATKILCNFSEDTNTYGNPSLALKIGHLLKKCAKIKKSSALSSGDSDLGKNADDFLTLLDDEWTDEISSSALQTLNTNKMNKGQLLPLTEDLKKLQCYFQEKSKSLSASLQNSFSKPDWELLNQLTLARLVMFNRRRGGETQRITLEGYAAKLTKHDSLQEIKDSLSPVEKMLCETFGRVEIRGKKGRTVPVLLTPAIQQSID
ncbi:uncharacterized protein LOC117319405, partial [Pecten maximus]|uniref:uncharacterized protein LOC117319405 n=1 Tax=Pecten maximus TaxID=6579 RepID=UPI0014587D0A